MEIRCMLEHVVLCAQDAKRSLLRLFLFSTPWARMRCSQRTRLNCAFSVWNEAGVDVDDDDDEDSSSSEFK